MWYNASSKLGNYWSDYTKKYPNAMPKILRPNIWNTPYGIEPHPLVNKDRFPLVNPYIGQGSHSSQQQHSIPSGSPSNK
jgi:hypothetical protein